MTEEFHLFPVLDSGRVDQLRSYAVRNDVLFIPVARKFFTEHQQWSDDAFQFRMIPTDLDVLIVDMILRKIPG